MGRKRAATSALATTCAERPIPAASAPRAVAPGVLTNRPIPGDRTVKSEPRPGDHSDQVRKAVSTVTERRCAESGVTCTGVEQTTCGFRREQGTRDEGVGVDSPTRRCLCSLY